MRGKPLFYGRQRRENAPDTKTINAYEYTSHSGDGPADPRSGPDGEPRADLHGRFYPEGFRPVCRRRYFRRAKRSRRTSGRMVVRYDFADQRKIPRIGENRTEDYARSLLRRAHESRIRPCWYHTAARSDVLRGVRDRSALPAGDARAADPARRVRNVLRGSGIRKTRAAPMRSAASAP